MIVAQVAAKTTDELLEELADLSEVIRALAQANGLSMEQVKEARVSKKRKKAGLKSASIALTLEWRRITGVSRII